ncbi:MAG TPA: sigma-70 family RNA polymerase sigma factor [Polyangia bacterium]|jgi:RNA polymerase sigma-70 factor (ECF subfamily)
MSINTASECAPTIVGAAPDTAALYRDYARRVSRWATRLTRSTSDAEDVVQEVFLIVHRRASSLNDVGSPGSWLLKVTLNVVRHLWRSRGRLSKREESFDWEGSTTAPPDPLQALETHRSLEKLRAAIDTLAPHYRTVYLLCEVNRLPTEKVAELTGLRPDTLRVRRHRARQQIARQLNAGTVIDACAA